MQLSRAGHISKFISGAIAPPPLVDDTVALDAPMTNAMGSRGLHAYGIDRMVEGYTGNTVQLACSDATPTQQDFGFNANGYFDLDAVMAWQGSAAVTVVKVYDQKGSNDLIANGTISFLSASGSPERFGAIRSTSDGQLTRSNTLGGVGMNFGDDDGFLVSENTYSFDTTNGVELTMLWSPNERKVGSGDVADDPYGGNSDDEYLFTFANGADTYFRNLIGSGSNTTDFVRVKTSTGNETNESSGVTHKKFGQQVSTFAFDATNMKLYYHGVYEERAFEALDASEIEAGNFAGSKLVIGNTFTNTSFATRTTLLANILFGGALITVGATENELYMMRSKLNAIGQQHRVQSLATIESYFDEYFVHKDIVSGTGVLAGAKGQTDLVFDTGGTTDWDFAYTRNGVGIQGVRSPTENLANGFKANSTFFAGTTSGTVVSTHYSEDGANDLAQALSQASGSPNDQGDMSFGLGYDHNLPSVRSKMAESRDTDNLMGTRKKADETDFGAAIYDGLNQALGKYNDKTFHGAMAYDETFDSHTWDIDDWANNGDQPYDLDAPVTTNIVDQTSFHEKDGVYLKHIFTFEAPAGYDRADDYTTRKALRLQSDNYSYLGTGASPIGHKDGDIAHEPNGGVVDSVDDAYIMSQNETGSYRPWIGDRYFAGFSSTVWTQTQVEEFDVNDYKFYE